MTEPKNILDLFLEYTEEVKENFAAYALAGAGIGMVMIPSSIILVFVVYGAAALGALPGLAAEDELMLVVGALTSTIMAVFVCSMLLNLLVVPMHASMLRAIDEHQSGESEGSLSFDATWASFTENMRGPLIYIALQLVIYLFLLFFCLFPGLIFILIIDFAWPLVVLEQKGPLAAMRISAVHFRDHIAWHLGYLLILVSVAFVLAYVPLVGAFISPGLVGGWRVFVYRQIRQDLLSIA